MKANIFRMRLAGAELVKHCINTFLGASVTLANQWSDVAQAYGVDFNEVAKALRADPRIGGRAYITPGIGFSGGTLGRDLSVLESVNQGALHGRAPIFGQIHRYNHARAEQIVARVAELAGAGGSVALLGMTYKPGTSTLRRSRPVEIAQGLRARRVTLRVHDPKAAWDELPASLRLEPASDPYAAATGASLAVILTEWPEYKDLDLQKLARGMAKSRLLDPKGVLAHRARELRDAGFEMCTMIDPVN